MMKIKSKAIENLLTEKFPTLKAVLHDNDYYEYTEALDDLVLLIKEAQKK